MTREGLHQLQRARRLAAHVEAQVLGGPSTVEREQLLELLRRALVSTPPSTAMALEEGDQASP